MPRIRIFALAFIVFILIGSIYCIHKSIFLSLDHILMDSFFRTRGSVAASPDLLLVGLDRESSAKIQRKSGDWNRQDFARAILNLTSAGADLIAIDYIFAIPDADPAQDEILETALLESANVVLATDVSGTRPVVPIDRFRTQEVGEGFVNLFPENDSKIRRIPPLRLSSGSSGEFQFDLPFSLQVALLRLYPQGEFQTRLNQKGIIQFGDLRIPYSGTKSTDGFWINFSGPPGNFPVLPFYRVLKNDFNAKDVQGKIVLIGNMNPLQHDYYPVPFSGSKKASRNTEGWDEHSMKSMFGVEIHANAVQTILTRAFIAPVAISYQILTSLILGAIAAFISLNKRWPAVISALLLLLLMIISWILLYILFSKGWFFPPATPLLLTGIILITGVISKQLEDASEKRYVTGLFGKYVSPGIVQELITNQNLIQLSGRRQKLTIFFSDIRGFTTLSERLPPEEVSLLLNEYFRRMTAIVFRHGGTLDKFIGDAVMAFFGNPVALPDHAERAVNMALEMKEEVPRLVAHWKEQGKEYDFQIGMGISTGEVIVGNLGSETFFDYTVIGDDVNLASRLQGIAEHNEIIISEKTFREVEGIFQVQQLEPVHVKGKTKPVQIYKVLRRAEVPSPS